MSIRTLIPDLGHIATDAANALHQDLVTDTLARTIWGEARGEGVPGMEAVACVIMNRLAVSRAKAGFWWGDSVIQICQKPAQFSCWNKQDPNYPKLVAVGMDTLDFVTALRIARRALNSVLHDQTSGATHYHTADIHPYWARGLHPSAVIGHHIFYRIA